MTWILFQRFIFIFLSWGNMYIFSGKHTHLNCFFMAFSFSDEFLCIYLRELNVYHSWNIVEEIVCVRKNHKWKYPPFKDKHPIFRNSSDFPYYETNSRKEGVPHWYLFRPSKTWPYQLHLSDIKKFGKSSILQKITKVTAGKTSLSVDMTYISVPIRNPILNSLERNRCSLKCNLTSWKLTIRV